MNLLPGLTATQEQFAKAYFPIFDDAKSVVLIIAGMSLMTSQEEENSSAFIDDFARVVEEANRLQRHWAAYTAGEDVHAVYLDVENALAQITNACERVHAEELTASSLAGITSILLDAYHTLREIALSLWHLELVPESAIHHMHEH